MNDKIYKQAGKELDVLIENLKKCEHLCIYSAGNRAKEIIQMCKLGFLEIKKPECFLVTEMKGNRESIDNPQYIDNIPVYVLNEYTAEEVQKDKIVLVAAMEHYHDEIRNSLQESQFEHIFYLSDIMERILVARCVTYYYKKLGLPFSMSEMRTTDCGIWNEKYRKNLLMTYMVQCAQDVVLKEEQAVRGWVTPLQAGAALTDKRVCEMTDADGENISDKNTYYNEMTGLYWLWKNTDIRFSGICHYRRQFESDIALQPLLDGIADVILPMPAIVYPDLKGYYRNWGEESYYEMMLQVVEELEPDYYETAVWCAEHEIFYPNNIFIAKREIVENYCQFAFKVLDEVEHRMQNRDDKKQKRCWLSEHVTTIYFMKHVRDYKIVFSNLKRYW